MEEIKIPKQSALEKEIADLRQDVDDLIFKNKNVELKNILTFDFKNNPAAQSVPFARLKHSNDSEKTMLNVNYSKIKEIKVNTPLGATIVRFDLKTNNAPLVVNGKIYINGIAVGEQKYADSGDYETQEDTITSINKGDLLQVYVKYYSASATAAVRNFRIYYIHFVTPPSNFTNQDPV